MSRLVELARNMLRRASSDYEIVEGVVASDGWRDAQIAQRQHEAWQPIVRAAREGHPRPDVAAAADAVREARLTRPSLIEIGCGTGYYSEMLPLLAGELRYTGVDYSPAMIALARTVYTASRFITADAARLPFLDATFDIGLSGNSLMHIPDYAAAIFETARVSRRWCIFHSVPVTEMRPTTRLRKKAYGTDVFEIVFQRGEIESLFAQAGLAIHSTRETMPYDLRKTLGEPTRLLTYACAREKQ